MFFFHICGLWRQASATSCGAKQVPQNRWWWVVVVWWWSGGGVVAGWLWSGCGVVADRLSIPNYNHNALNLYRANLRHTTIGEGRERPRWADL